MALEGTLSVDVSGDVTFEYEVTNAGTSPVELTFRSGKRADVVVRDGDEEVWRWSDGRMFTQAIQEYSMDPNEVIIQEFTWKEPASGTYEATARLAADQTATATVSFTV